MAHGMQRGHTKFTQEQDDYIRGHYGQDMSANQIARALGLTKNSVVGRAGRLGLAVGSRNPIIKGGPGRPRPKPKPAGRGPVSPPSSPRWTGEHRPRAGRAIRFGSARACQWIDGRPSMDDGCKCGAPAVKGHAYCLPHLKRAYIKPGQRRDTG